MFARAGYKWIKDPMGGEQASAIAVAVGGALIGATLVEMGAGERGNLRLQQLLKAASHNLRDQGASVGSLNELAQLGAAIMGEGHGLCSVWW